MTIFLDSDVKNTGSIRMSLWNLVETDILDTKLLIAMFFKRNSLQIVGYSLEWIPHFVEFIPKKARLFFKNFNQPLQQQH